VSTVDGTAAVIEAAGDVDILVNNAGIFAPMRPMPAVDPVTSARRFTRSRFIASRRHI
jgi:NAD(P)-dependent dehydrogenase (short-subunit alcohol dehydrogenase family)